VHFLADFAWSARDVMARGNRREAIFLVDDGGESELDWREVWDEELRERGM
jgi:hypothetical protein